MNDPSHKNMDTNNIDYSYDNYQDNKDLIVTPWEVSGVLEDKMYIKLI